MRLRGFTGDNPLPVEFGRQSISTIQTGRLRQFPFTASTDHPYPYGWLWPLLSLTGVHIALGISAIQIVICVPPVSPNLPPLLGDVTYFNGY